MSTYTDVERFLQAVFPDWAEHAIFAHSLISNSMAHTRKLTGLFDTCDCYWSIASFPDDLSTTRTLDRALEVRALVIDDVGTKVSGAAVLGALGPPTAIVETSAGNFQWVYRLATPVAVADWRAFFAEIERRVGQKLEGRDAVHLFRLPMGVNTKAGRGNFAVRLMSISTAVFHAGNAFPVAAAAPSGASSGPEPRIRGIGKVLDLIPNNDEPYDEWIARAHQVKALALDEEEGAEAFDEWSQKSTKYDAAETARRWATVKPSRTAGLTLLADAEAADPAGFAAVMNAEAGAAFDDKAVHPKIDTSTTGGAQFHEGEKGILSTMENAAIGLNGLGIVCRYDEFHHRVHVRWKGRDERLTDDLVLLLRVEMNGRYGKDFGPVHIGDAIKALALRNGFNPVTEMLRDAEALWDGVARLDRLGPDYFHTDDTPLARACFRKVMLAAVRRARRPGCKFDQILVLESPEGWDKSTAWAVLAGEGNFSDADILGKDARAVQEELADIWIHEIADLSGLSRTDIEHVKAFASRTNDRARGAYERFLKDQPRQSVEVGTTNSDAYLLSTTGNRRFWPFRMKSRVDIARLRADRLLLWGEAAAAESAGETLVLDAALWDAAAAEQEERRVIDPWEDELANLPDTLFKDAGGYTTITNVAIHDHLGGHRGGQINGAGGRKIAEIMRRLGWERTYLKDAVGVKVRGYRRRTDENTSVLSSVPKNPF